MGNAPPNTRQDKYLRHLIILFVGFLLFFTNGVRAAENQPPKANAASVTTSEDTKIAIKLTGKDPEKQPLTYAIVTQPAHGKVVLKGNVATYTPTANYNGKDTFTFTVKDGVLTSPAATVDITVTPVNDAPTCVTPISSINVTEDTLKTISLSCKDVDGDTLTYNANTPPAAPPSHGTALVYTNIVTYTPEANYNGADSFTFKARDGLADSLPVTVNLNVTAINDAPTANNQNTIVITGSPASITLAGDDVDGDKLTYNIVNSTKKGVLSQTSIGSDTLTYIPSAGFIGTDSFTFRVNDGKLSSKVATVNIDVQTPYTPYVYNPSCILCESAYTKNTNNKVFRAKNFSSPENNQLIDEISTYLNDNHLADYGRINWDSKKIPRDTIAAWVTKISGNNLVAVDGEPSATLLDIRAKRNDGLNKLNTALDTNLQNSVQFWTSDPFDRVSFIFDTVDGALSAAQDAVIITGAFPRKVKIKFHYTKLSLTSVTKKIKKYSDMFGKFKDSPTCVKVISDIASSQEIDSNDVIDGASACTSWTIALFEDIKKLKKIKGTIKGADGFQALTASTITNFKGMDDSEIKMAIFKEALDFYDFIVDMASAGGIEVTGPLWASIDLIAQGLKAYVNGVEMAEKASKETDEKQNELLIAYTEEVKKIRNSYNVQFMYLMSPAFKVVDLKKDTYITSVTPSIATASSSTLFTVVGGNLPATLYATLDAVKCNAQGIQTLVKRQYLCSVPNKNSVEFVVRTNDDLPVIGTPITVPISKVTNISPLGAGLNMPVTITVTGENLPSTAIFAMADAYCETPTNKTTKGFTIVCTPKGNTGVKPIIVKDKPKGSVIDDTRSITVISAELDTDHDLMPDYWELQYGLNPNVDDAAGNLDSDDFTNLQEFEAKTKPNDINDQPSVYIIGATSGDQQVTLSVDARGAMSYDLCYADEPFIDRLNCTLASGKAATFLQNQTSPITITGLENGKKYYFIASVGDTKPSNQATATPTTDTTTTSCSKPIKSILFKDSFDGASIDTTKWDVDQTGGSAILLDGKLSVLSNGSNRFPVIQTKENPFPTTGNFSFYCKTKYTNIGSNGTGACVAVQKMIANGSASYSYDSGNVLQLWADSALGGIDLLVNNTMYGGTPIFANITPNDAAEHEYEICVIDSQVTGYRDHVKVGEGTLPNNWQYPTKIWMGNPVLGSAGYPWSTFDTDEIEVRQLEDGIDPTGWIQNPTTGHYYKALDNCGNWEDCEKAAKAVGAHLVVIEDQAENDWVANTFKIAATEMGYWIGYTDKEQEGVWKTVTGEIPTYTNWLSGEPNNGGGRENYAQFMYYGTYGWNDVAGDNYYNWSKYPNTGIIERTTAP